MTTAAAAAVAATTLYLGRRDVTRPAVAFGVVWFACVALAQLRLTEIETAWSTGFTLLAFAGGLAFMLAATLAGGTAAARRRITVPRDDYLPRRLLAAALVLGAGGLLGIAYKADVLGGLPLLSDRPDVLRAKAHGNVPSWSTALTDGFFLAMWCVLAAIWLLRKRTSRPQLVALALLAAACLFGVALLASRNTILFSLLVPLTAVYLLLRSRRRIGRAGLLVTTVAVVAVVMGGLYVARLSQGDRDTFLDREMDRQPVVLQPLIPFYLNAVYPLEAASRVYRSVPERHAYTLGGASLTSLPDAAFPEGKPQIGTTFAALMRSPVADAPTWSVASYQGRLYTDAGWPGVVLGSLLLGLGFGALYRWARSRAGFVPVALVGYLAYYAAFMVYDNSLSFSLIAFYDLAVVGAIDLYARGKVRSTIAALLEPSDERAKSATG